MTKIFVYAAKPALAEQTIQTLKTAGAAHAELLETLSIPARQPKENRYLFICETPVQKLSALAPKVLPEAEYAQELGQWYEAQCQIVTTATAQKKRSIVVTSGQTCDAKSLLTSINDLWGLSLKVQDAEAPSVEGEEPLLAYLVQNLIEQAGPLQALQNEINSLAGVENEPLHEVDALTGYRGLVKQRIELQSQNHQLVSTQTKLNNQLKDLTEETELLHAQLHTVQEELEKIFLEAKDFKESATKEKADLTAARDAQAKAAADKQKQVETLTNEKATLAKEKADITAARDAQAKAAAEKQKQVETLTQEKSNLAKEKADLTAARDAQANATKEATEEAKLLLLQLHQVQEELEHHFLKNLETEAKLAKQQARLQRLLQQYPNYIDTESVQVEVVDPTTQTLKWIVQWLESQGIAKNYLEFDTFIESGVLGIRFNKTNSRNELTLKNWPASCEGETIDCIPAGKGNVMRQRAMTLRELSASDWKLLNTLPQLIKQHLNNTALEAKLCTAVNDAANKLTLGINALPKTFRYDAVTLKSNKVNPDYEHLWFELHNTSFDTYYWPKFEFRLGATNIKPGKFSDHPKLEIPLIDGKTKPFDSWFEESYDDYGGKYELRFDLKRGIADKETFLKLAVKDQSVVKALVSCLPALLQECGVNGSNVTRPAENWKDLASTTSRLVL